jgi:nicotinamidase/pyrazinamidase
VKTVFFDIDTQLDFLCPAGALHVPGAERIVGAISRLNAHAVSQGIPLVSTMDAHSEDDAEFRSWPPHCVAGTLGQRKSAATLVARTTIVRNAAGADLGLDAPQIVVEKQSVDAFSNPYFPKLVEALGVERCVVYGVALDVCVRHAAFGLLKMGRRVEIVENAVRGLSNQNELQIFNEFRAAGGFVISASALLD